MRLQASEIVFALMLALTLATYGPTRAVMNCSARLQRATKYRQANSQGGGSCAVLEMICASGQRPPGGEQHAGPRHDPREIPVNAPMPRFNPTDLPIGAAAPTSEPDSPPPGPAGKKP